MRNLLCCLLTLVILESCTTVPPTESAVVGTEIESSVSQTMIAPRITITPTHSSVLIGTPALKPSGTHIPTTTDMALQGYLYPPIIQVCPEDREVPLSELDLPSELRLLLLPPDVQQRDPTASGIMMISSSNPDPALVKSTIPRDGWENRLFSISPNGRWIRYYSLQQDGTDGEIWISSVGGDQAWAISENVNNMADWVSDQEIVLTGMPYTDERYDPYAVLPLFSMNPFTMVLRELYHLPQGSNFLTYFTEYDVPYAVYYESLASENICLYNYNDDTSEPVFQWLAGESDRTNSSIVWSYTDEGKVNFRVVVNRQYGVDLVMGLDLDVIRESLEYDNIMSRIIIPDDYPNTWIAEMIGETSMIVGRGNFSAPEYPGERYVFDYTEMILWDYCIEEETKMMMAGSPDGRFIAYTFFNLDQYGHAVDAREVVILNLETGYITRIQDIQAIGWGWEDDSTP